MVVSGSRFFTFSFFVARAEVVVLVGKLSPRYNASLSELVGLTLLLETEGYKISNVSY